MVDACAQLSLLRKTTDSILTSLEVEASNFARITNDMVHLHKEEYVLACFKDTEAAKAVVTRIIEFLQSWSLEVGSKLTGSGLFVPSSPPPDQDTVADASRDVPMKEVTLLPEASTSASGVPVSTMGSWMVMVTLRRNSQVSRWTPDYLYFVFCSRL